MSQDLDFRVERIQIPETGPNKFGTNQIPETGPKPNKTETVEMKTIAPFRPSS